ncbi:MAG TPA: hypothetical protein VES67_06195 [Vicinamibacterales bacterium]|nr:hypothetical protein [Vicinamibacterales bacterium]
MTAKRAPKDKLFETRWVHVSEQDTPDGAVFRPDDEHVPLSRKPRDWLEVHEDGSATLYTPGPDDRPVERRATWQDVGGGSGTRRGGGEADVQIVERSPLRLVVKLRTAPDR